MKKAAQNTLIANKYLMIWGVGQYAAHLCTINTTDSWKIIANEKFHTDYYSYQPQCIYFCFEMNHLIHLITFQ